MYSPSRLAQHGLTAIAEEDVPGADAAESASAHGGPPAGQVADPSLRGEVRHWLAAFEALRNTLAQPGDDRDPMRPAMSHWCGHLIRVTQQAMALEDQGDRTGAWWVVRDFPGIFDGCYKLLAHTDRRGGAAFLDGRTTLMQRVVGGDFSQRLREIPDLRELDRTMNYLCRCSNPGEGFILLRETARILGADDDAVWPVPLQRQTDRPVAGVSGPRPRPPAHPAPAEPQRRAHR